MSSVTNEINSSTSEDHLDVDAEIPGQKFVCLSFISPEKVLKQKEEFFREQFWKYLKQNTDENRFDLSILDNISDVYSYFFAIVKIR